MTRSIKALSSAAMLAALALPTVASAQDTSSTGGRVTRDSASARSMGGMRFDASQAVTLTNVTIVRIDSTAGGQGNWRRDDKKSGDAAGAMGTAGTMGSTGTTGTGSTGSTGTSGMGSSSTTGMGSTSTAMTPAQGASKGQPLSAIVRSGTDSMTIVLGPSEYLTSKQLTLAAGDVIAVKGVRMEAGASGMAASTTTTILATEISKGSTTVQLRDKSTGAPSWGMMGADAAKNRGSMTTPPMTKDTNRTTPPVRMP